MGTPPVSDRSPNLPPLQKVRYPNVTLSTLPKFESDLKKWFHRAVPIWITEYGHETKPGEPRGVTTAKQAAYAKQALTIARNDPNVQMFIWFTFRDSSGNPWQSGLENPSGSNKPSYAAFSSLARLIDGTTVNARPGVAPRVRIYVPYLNYYAEVGSGIGVNYRVMDGSKHGCLGQPTVPLAPDQSVIVRAGLQARQGPHLHRDRNGERAERPSDTRSATIRSRSIGRCGPRLGGGATPPPSRQARSSLSTTATAETAAATPDDREQHARPRRTAAAVASSRKLTSSASTASAASVTTRRTTSGALAADACVVLDRPDASSARGAAATPTAAAQPSTTARPSLRDQVAGGARDQSPTGRAPASAARARRRETRARATPVATARPARRPSARDRVEIGGRDEHHRQHAR